MPWWRRVGQHLDGSNVGHDAGDLLGPFDDGETGHVAVLLGDPGGGILRRDELAHVATGEALRRLKADLFDGVEIVEVFALEKAVVHGEVS